MEADSAVAVVEPVAEMAAAMVAVGRVAGGMVAMVARTAAGTVVVLVMVEALLASVAGTAVEKAVAAEAEAVRRVEEGTDEARVASVEDQKVVHWAVAVTATVASAEKRKAVRKVVAVTVVGKTVAAPMAIGEEPMVLREGAVVMAMEVQWAVHWAIGEEPMVLREGAVVMAMEVQWAVHWAVHWADQKAVHWAVAVMATVAGAEERKAVRKVGSREGAMVMAMDLATVAVVEEWEKGCLAEVEAEGAEIHSASPSQPH